MNVPLVKPRMDSALIFLICLIIFCLEYHSKKIFQHKYLFFEWSVQINKNVPWMKTRNTKLQSNRSEVFLRKINKIITFFLPFNKQVPWRVLFQFLSFHNCFNYISLTRGIFFLESQFSMLTFSKHLNISPILLICPI